MYNLKKKTVLSNYYLIYTKIELKNLNKFIRFLIKKDFFYLLITIQKSLHKTQYLF